MATTKASSADRELRRRVRGLHWKAEGMADDQGRLTVLQFGQQIDDLVGIVQDVFPESEWPRIGVLIRSVLEATAEAPTFAAEARRATARLLGEDTTCH